MQEAELSMLRRVGPSEDDLLLAQGNLACTYEALGRSEQALSIRRNVYSGRLKLDGEEDEDTLAAANNYALSLLRLQRLEEAKALLRKTLPVAQRVLGEINFSTIRMRACYAEALYGDPSATLRELREAVTTLEDAERIAQRVLGGAHPLTEGIEEDLNDVRAALRARETGLAGALADMRV